jgi:hypothetical protein
MVKSKLETETNTATGNGLSRESLEARRAALQFQLEQATANANAIQGAVQLVDQLLADHFPVTDVGEEA